MVSYSTERFDVLRGVVYYCWDRTASRDKLRLEWHELYTEEVWRKEGISTLATVKRQDPSRESSLVAIVPCAKGIPAKTETPT